MTRSEAEATERDLLMEVLRRIQSRLPAFDDAALLQIEAEVRRDLGGERVRIAKRRKHLTAAERDAVFQAGLTNVSDEQITSTFKISRRTLFRYMKRG